MGVDCTCYEPFICVGRVNVMFEYIIIGTVVLGVILGCIAILKEIDKYWENL